MVYKIKKSEKSDGELVGRETRASKASHALSSTRQSLCLGTQSGMLKGYSPFGRGAKLKRIAKRLCFTVISAYSEKLHRF